jgi:hypothetical protein
MEMGKKREKAMPKQVLHEIVLVAAVIATSASALLAARPVLPMVEHADTETVTNVAFAAWEPVMREFLFDLEFSGTASNNVEMAFGVDSDGDGALSDGEAGLLAGWDCGALFVADNATDERVAAAASNGVHVFSCVFGIRSSGSISEVVFTDNGVEVFHGLAADKPSWLHSTNWNMVRLVGRGENVRVGDFRKRDSLILV